MTEPTSDRPRVQCSTGPFWAVDLEMALDALAEAGFAEIEMMVTRDPRTQTPELPAELARERGLRIGAVHGPFLVLTKRVWGMDPIEKIRRGADYCRVVGASVQIVHPPLLWERDYARWLVDEAPDFAADTGVAIAVETMYPRWLAGRRARAYRWLEPEDLVAAAPNVAMDTSHLTVARRDILEAFQLLAPKLAHVHLSDNAGDGRDGHLELEQGILPIDRFLGALRRSDYAGAISLEVSVRRYLERPKDVVEMLRRNKEFVEERLSKPGRTVKGLPR